MAYTARGYILLVEDNPDDELLTLRALNKNNIANPVHVVRDGQEALDFLFSPDSADGVATLGLPEFVLLDLQLPKIGGIEVLCRIRGDETTRRVPVIVLTTSDEEHDVLDSYGLGANSYVRKPIDFKEFVDVVGQLGLYWLIHNVSCPGIDAVSTSLPK